MIINTHHLVLDITESRAIERKFATLLLKFNDSLQRRKVQVSKVILALGSLKSVREINSGSNDERHCSLFEKDIEQVTKAEDFDSVFMAVSNYISFFEFYVIEILVDHFGDQLDKENLKSYNTEFREYARGDIPIGAKMNPSISANPPTILRIKLDQSYSKITYETLQILKSKFAEIYDISKDALLLEKVEEGSIILFFKITPTVEKKIFLAHQNVSVALQKVGVLSISCNDHHIDLKGT